MKQALRGGLAVLLILALILTVPSAGAKAANLDEEETSTVSQVGAAVDQTDESTEDTAEDGETTEETTETTDSETQEPSAEDTDPAETDEASDGTEAADPTEEETAEDATSEDEGESASTTRTAACKRSYVKKGTTFRILLIGNSYSIDTTKYLYQVATDAGYDVVVGNLEKGAASLANHWKYAKSNSAVYTYRKNSTGSWTSTGSVTMAQAVEDEDWDIIFFQQQSSYAGVSDKFYSGDDNYLTLLSDYVAGLCGNADVKIGYEMTWAHQDGSTESICQEYFGGDQMTMYTAICSATQEAVVTSGAVDLIAPVGTAIQNARSSYLGDTLNRDNSHLSYGLGRWLAAMSLASACGMDLSGITAINSNSSYGVYSALLLDVLKQSIADAEESPYTITAQSTTVPTLSAPSLTTSTSGSKLTIQWSSVGATGYEVYRIATSGGSSTSVTTLAAGQSSYSYTGSTDNSYYIYALGDDYITGTFDTSVSTVAQPSLSSVTNASGSRLTIQWSAVSSVTGYQVQTATNSSFTKNVRTATVSGTSKTTSGRTNGTKYYVRVRAYRTVSGTKYYSAWSTVKYIRCVSAPTLSSVINASSSRLTIKWSAVSSVTGYQVQTATNSSFTKNVKTANVSGTSQTTSGRTNGTKYYVRVRAYKTVSGTNYYSAWSSSRSIYCVSAPSLTSLKNVKTKKMTVKWSKNAKATGYQIRYSTSSSFSSYKTVTVTSCKTVSKTISCLIKGRKYYVRIRAYKTVSGTRYYSAWSKKKSVKISK